MKGMKLIALVFALAASGTAGAADSHTVHVRATVLPGCAFNSPSSTIELTLDPAATTTVTQSAAVTYRCTRGSGPAFTLRSGSTNSDAGGNLVNGTESIPYTFSYTSGGSGTGRGAGQDRTLTVNVSVNQTGAANVTPNVYTDTITITVTP